MHTIFGIVKWNSSQPVAAAHASCIKVLGQKFAAAFAGKPQSFSAPLDLMGDFEHASAGEQYELFFCGEIFNRPEIAAATGEAEARFPDTAALLLAFFLKRGLDQTAALNGRFSICWVDKRQRRIHLLSDQMGIQQLFYFHHNDFLLFGSEIKFLLQHPLCPRRIDWAHSLKRPVPFVVLDGERHYNAWFQDVFLLKEATDLQIQLPNGKLTPKPYWNPYAGANNSVVRSAEQAMEEYIALLEDAVRIRVQDSDVAASFLSGGLDSSILCVLARKYRPLNTYTAITPNTLLDSSTEIGARLAMELDFNSVQYLVPYNAITIDHELWKKRIWKAESPVVHTDSLVKSLLHDSITRHEKSIPAYMLTGTGSDQMNGGLARWIVADQDDPEKSWQQLSRQLYEEELRGQLPEKHHALWGARHYLTKGFVESISGRNMEDTRWHFYMKSNLHLNLFTLLWDENRAVGARNRSVRYPFLDHRFVPLIAGIPENLHPALFYDKQILRTPATRFLPEYVTHKPKMPAPTGRYDKRMQTYAFMARYEDGLLIREALGEWNEPHPVIDKKALLAEIAQLEIHPDPIAWQYVINVINLGLLEKLAEQDDQSLDCETQLAPYVERIAEWSDRTLHYCKEQQGIITETALLEETVLFAEDCFLVQDVDRQRLFIVKNEVLVYEIEEENPAWEHFLKSIGQRRSTREILEELQLPFEDIREYFYLCIKENILTTQSH
ncbi:MAG: asparagine synthase-related protein [Saprospiraceae bacterium]